MGLSEKDIDRLGPAARAQIAAALNHAAARKETLRPKRADEFESALEARYYEAEIAPKIYAGLIDTVEAPQGIFANARRGVLRAQVAQCKIYARFLHHIQKRRRRGRRSQKQGSAALAKLVRLPPPPVYRTIRPPERVEIHRGHFLGGSKCNLKTRSS